MLQLIKKHLLNLAFGKSNSLIDNIAVSIAVTLTSAFVFYDYRGYISGPLRIAVTCFMFLVWMMCAFSSGKTKKWGFLVFTGAYWLIPNLYMIYYSTRDNVRGYSKCLSFLNKSSDILVDKPFEYLAEKMNFEIYYLTIFLFILVVTVYFISLNITELMHRKEKEERF